MRQFFITVLGTICGIFIGMFLLFILIMGIAAAFTPKPERQSAIVLELDLQQPLLDQSSGGELFGDSMSSIISIVRKLDQGKTDKTVKGLFVRANPYSMSPAQADELRIAISDFQQSGKFVVVHAQGFEGTSLSPYVAVSASDNIWIQQTSNFATAGYRAETPFYGGVFEKFDAKPEFMQFKDYKTAVNSYTKSDYTEAHRESTTVMLESLFNAGVNTIATDREFSVQATKDLLNGAPYSAEKAVELGLADKLGYYVEAREHALELAGNDAKFKDMNSYILKATKGEVIAIIGGQGAIMPGKSLSPTPLSTTTIMGSDTISEALDDAVEDEDVKAIILRVDSPGGAASAGDQIWFSVERAAKAGKPVIISMASYAASAGYYISAPADKIIALPTTLTGSIGVYGGKLVLNETFDKVGYNVEPISVGGEYTAAYSAVETLNQRNRAAYYQTMEDIYVDFTSRVAEGRGMSADEVEALAQGRVWTGEQALENGLVDELGGFMRAIEAAKELAEIDAKDTVRLRRFPKAMTAAEELQQILGVSLAASQSLEQLNTIARLPEVQAALSARKRLTDIEGAQLLAPLPVID